MFRHMESAMDRGLFPRLWQEQAKAFEESYESGYSFD